MIELKINSVLFYFISTETLLATYCKLSQRITKYQKERAIISFVSTIFGALLMIRLSEGNDLIFKGTCDIISHNY